MSTNPAGPQPLARPPRRARRRRLSMRRGVPLRESLLLAFAGILSAARAAARRPTADPVEAVHEYRKAIRRARALVSLLRPALGRAAAAGLSDELRRAFAATGALRDAHILVATLRSAAPDDPARAAIEEVLERGSEGAPTPAEVLAGRPILRSLPDVLRVTLPRAYSMDDLARGLARGFRRQRRALELAEESGRPADFHAWRKRVKELRYQVELLASTGSPELKRREKALAALARELGAVTDLVVLESELTSRRDRSQIPEAANLFARLRETIAGKSRALMDSGKELLAEAPADFARRILAERG